MAILQVCLVCSKKRLKILMAHKEQIYYVTLLSRLIFEELLNPVRLFLERAKRTKHGFFEMLVIRQGPGVESLSFGYAPNLLAGVEFWRVAWQIMQGQPRGVLAGKILGRSRAMSRSSVHDQEKLSPGKVSVERFQKPDKGHRIEVAFGKLKKQMALLTDRRGDSHVNAALTRNSHDRFESGKSPGFADMGNEHEETLVGVEKDSSRTSAKAKNLWQNLLFPLTHRLQVLFQGARLGSPLNEAQSSQEPGHVFGVKGDAKHLADQTPDSWSRPKIRPKAVARSRMMQNPDQFGEMGRFQFRLGSGRLAGPERLQAILMESLHPSEHGRTIQSHGEGDVLDPDSAFDHPYRRETHLLQRPVIDGVTIPSGRDRHANTLSWNPSQVYLTRLHSIRKSLGTFV